MGRNKTQTRSIKPNDMLEEGGLVTSRPGDLVTSRPVSHVTVLTVSETKEPKKKVTPESEMMDEDILHPTALMEYYELRKFICRILFYKHHEPHIWPNFKYWLSTIPNITSTFTSMVRLSSRLKQAFVQFTVFFVKDRLKAPFQPHI